MSGSYAYVADQISGLRVITIASAASPTEVGSCDIPAAMGVAVSGSYAFVVAYDDGLRVVNLWPEP